MPVPASVAGIQLDFFGPPGSQYSWKVESDAPTILPSAQFSVAASGALPTTSTRLSLAFNCSADGTAMLTSTWTITAPGKNASQTVFYMVKECSSLQSGCAACGNCISAGTCKCQTSSIGSICSAESTAPPAVLNANTLKVLSWDTYGVGALEDTLAIEARYNSIGAHVLQSNADIVAMQSVVSQDARDVLVNNLRQQYPYIAQQTFGNGPTRFSGLFFASRFPVLKQSFEEFSATLPQSPDAFQDKGIFGALIRLTDSSYAYVFHTHVQSPVANSAPQVHAAVRAVQAAQLQQTRTFISTAFGSIAQQYPTSQVSLILLGNLNAGGSDGTNHLTHDEALKVLGNPRDLYLEHGPEVTEQLSTGTCTPALHARLQAASEIPCSVGDEVMVSSPRVDYALAWDSMDGISTFKTKTRSVSRASPAATSANGLSVAPGTKLLSDHPAYIFELDVAVDNTAAIAIGTTVGVVMFSVLVAAALLWTGKLSCAAPATVVTYARQSKILLTKNFLMSFRNRQALLVQLCVPFLFVAVLYVLQIAVRSNDQLEEAISTTLHSAPEPMTPIPRCVPPPGQVGCFTIGYTPKGNPLVEELIGMVAQTHQIPANEIIAWADTDEADVWLSEHRNTTQGVYHVTPVLTATGSLQSLNYSIQFNDTAYYVQRKTILPIPYVVRPMQMALDAELVRYQYRRSHPGAPELQVQVSTIKYPHPQLLSPDIIGQQGPVFFLGVLMFNFVTQLGQIVTEKELHLRDALATMGMRTSLYWATWAITNMCWNLLSALLLIASGCIFQFSFFLKNDFLTYFLLFTLFGWAMVPFAFFCSLVLNRARTATSFGFGMYLLGIMIQGAAFAAFVDSDSVSVVVLRTIFSFLPFALLSKGMGDLGSFTDGDNDAGLRWSERDSYDWFTIQSVYYWLLVSFATFLVLTIVCDYLFVSHTGESRVGRWRQACARWLFGKCCRHTAVEDEPVSDEAVIAEEQLVQSGTLEASSGIQIRGLRKVFAGGFVAVRNLWLHIEDHQLFCLLGHNGAGKTTTLSMMVGLLQATDGDINVFGHGLNRMDAIQQLMGVCPQHDVLWSNLTAAEHIALFAGLKGVPQALVAQEVETRLTEVGLLHVADKYAGEFSGGMQRRLSVAIALTGDPRVVYLDEPTTGMDPVSRRQVWDLLEVQKRKRLVLLTTHSMEEADILSDRIAIMKQGRLHCIGTSVRLKRRFGSGFRVDVLLDDDAFLAAKRARADAEATVLAVEEVDATPDGSDHVAKPDSALSAACQLMSRRVPDAVFSRVERQVAKFVVPTTGVQDLSSFLSEVETDAALHGVRDVQVGLTTLEDVFLAVTGHGRTEGMEQPVVAALDAPLTPSSVAVHVASGRRESFSFAAQARALASKSLVLQSRQRLTNLFQLALPVLLIIGLWALQRLVDSIVASSWAEYTEAVLHQPLVPSSFLVPATDFDAQECPKSWRAPVVDNGVGQLLFTTNGNSALEAILGQYGAPVAGDASQFWSAADVASSWGMPSGLLGNVTRSVSYMLGIPGNAYPEQFNRLEFCTTRPRILPLSFSSVPTKEDIDRILYGAWNSAPRAAAFVFEALAESSAAPVIKYSVMFNSTLTAGTDVSHINRMVTDALFRYFAPGDSRAASIEFAGTRNFPTERVKNTFDLISLSGPNVYVFLYQLLFPVFLGTLVYEKELKLRDIMRMMGLRNSVYWVVNYLLFLVMYMVATLAFEVLAALLDFRFFVVNDFGLVILFSFVWGNLLVAGTMLLSVFFSNARTATVVGYCIVFANGIIGVSIIQLLLHNVNTTRASVFGITMVPPFALMRGLSMLRDGVAFNAPGLQFDNVGEPGAEMDEVMWFMVVEWAVALLGTWYLEQVFPGSGVGASPLFFLRKSYWMGSTNTESVSESSNTLFAVQPQEHDEPSSVAKERQDVLTGNRAHDLIRIQNLGKVFAGQHGGSAPTVAVANLTMGVQRGECFGMLGPNGSGKTTTINCLCGYLAPSHGNAYVAGLSVLTSSDLVHLNMGVCPQDNVIWPELTGAEHLRFYGRLKDLSGAALEREVQFRLAQVELADVGNKKVGQYSGGMKRRLCVAVGLIGTPAVLLLDEPTTGLDPAARRTLWSVVESAKPSCATLLTTHSMEEAEALCDRVGMFVFGHMKCIGSPAALKSDLGDVLKLTIICDTSREQAAAAFIAEHVPEAVLLTEPIGGIRHYQCPRATTSLSKLFATLQDNWEASSINDWAVTNVSLEEVFLKVAGAH